MNENELTENNIYNYMMQPGDGTMYRFSIQQVNGSYAISSAASDDSIWLAINMPGGCGVSVIPKRMLEDSGLDGYLRLNGMGAVYPYTLKAVLLAASVLAFDPHDTERAAEKMLKAGYLLTSEG